MLVRKVRGQDKVGKIIVSRFEFESAKRMGVTIEAYIKQRLIQIAKKRRWKWYFNKVETNEKT
jgi:hypothetical protein